MWSFMTGFSHVACFPSSATLSAVSNVPSYECNAAFYLFIHQVMDVGLFPFWGS